MPGAPASLALFKDDEPTSREGGAESGNAVIQRVVVDERSGVVLDERSGVVGDEWSGLVVDERIEVVVDERSGVVA